MSGIDFLADTNILIYILEENPAVKSILNFSFAVSFISEMELLGKHRISSREVDAINALLSDCEIVSMNELIKKTVISLKQTQKLKLPDAIIAATAITLGIPLITADKSLSKIKDLNCLIVHPN